MSEHFTAQCCALLLAASVGLAQSPGPPLTGTVTFRNGATLSGVIETAGLGIVDGTGVGSRLPGFGSIRISVDGVKQTLPATSITMLEATWLNTGTPGKPDWGIGELRVTTTDGRVVVGEPDWRVHATTVSVQPPSGQTRRVHAFPLGGADFSPDNLMAKVQLNSCAATPPATPPAATRAEHSAAVPVAPPAISPIHQASRDAEVDKAVELLRREPGLARSVDPTMNGCTPLHLAGSEQIVELLLAKGASIDARDHDNATPLHWAVLAGRVEVVRALLVHHARVNLRDRKRLVEIKRGTKTDVFGLLAEVFARRLWTQIQVGNATPPPLSVDDYQTGTTTVKTRWVDSRTPLHYAAATGNCEISDLLLDSHAEVNVKDDEGLTALNWAVLGGHIGLVRSLLAHGADPNNASKTGSQVKDALAPYECTQAGAQPLYVALVRGDKEMASLLVASGAGRDPRDGYGSPLIACAARKSDAHMIEALCGMGSDVDAPDGRGATALDTVAAYGTADMAELLLKKGALVNRRDREGWTPLLRAVWHMAYGRPSEADNEARFAVISTLVAHGADPWFESRETYLWHRSSNSPIRFLREYRGDMPCKWRDMMMKLFSGVPAPAAAAPGSRGIEKDALHCAVVRDDRAAVEALLTAGADVNGLDEGGRTPLHWAAMRGNAELARLLLDRGAVVDRRDRPGGSTPLSLAVLTSTLDATSKNSDMVAVIRVLLAGGASRALLSAELRDRLTGLLSSTAEN